jgi:D-alanyl-D-alanine carboxypeptidase
MRPTLTQPLLDAIVEGAVKQKYIHGFVMDVRRRGRALTSAAGNLEVSSRFFAASVTKSFVTAVMLQLEAEGRIALDDAIADHLPGEIVDGLHVMNGVDRSATITVRHLMSNTSGIPDYFDKQTVTRLLDNRDEPWGLGPTLAAARGKRARFLPGHRASYSDTNYQLLGALIEAVAGSPLRDVFHERVIDPLGLADTYLYRGEPDDRLVPMYYKHRPLALPRYMASVGAEGGLVSTAADLGLFTQGFFGGKLFDPNRLGGLYSWRLLFAPGLFFYGVGIARQPVSIFALRGGLYGHWGQSGAFAFYDPGSRTCLSGTANQFVGQRQAARAMIKVLRHPLPDQAEGAGNVDA